ncbi:MAG: ABC transporter ATP-binding protein [Clostridia bacterium]|nr:ABC transporter ATP-binding protein [Clostridia bacterium]
MKEKIRKKLEAFREDLALVMRGYKLLHTIDLWLLPLYVILPLVELIAPYTTIWISAKLISLIAAGAAASELLFYAALVVGINFVMAVVTRRLSMLEDRHGDDIYEKIELYYQSVNMEMKYAHLENPETHILRDKIQYAAQNSNGLFKLSYLLRWFVRAFSNVIVSASMTFSLFFTRVEGHHTGLAAFIGSPWAILILAAVTVFYIIMERRSILEGQVFWTEQTAHFAEDNRIANHYMDMMNDYQSAAEIRIFNQGPLIERSWIGTIVHPKHVLALIQFNISHERWNRVRLTLLHISLYLFIAAKAYMGAFSIGSLVLYTTVMTNFITYFGQSVQSFAMIFLNNVYMRDVFAYLDLPNDMYQGTLKVEKRAFCEDGDNDYEIEFRDVSFRYPGAETYALRHVNLKFRIGEKMAVVGENGSGKTTFIKLLCRLYDPTEGKILLNGIDISRYDYADYMSIFSVVFQDFRLFSFSLGQNVAAGDIYDADKAIECLERAGFGARLAEMEAGLETCLYKNFDAEGVEISGGEAQKIALARALYKDAPFIILDEPTAALDPVAEFEVYSNFNTLAGSKTAIYISHRLSSCRFCEDIAVFDNGTIVMRGSHEELIRDENGKYHELWHAQAQYYEKA